MNAPDHIGRYEILEEIGRGAMGVVYLAHDPGLDRQVAIKTIHMPDMLPEGEKRELRERFLREARAAGRLQHPGIVTIYDVVEHEGRCFIAMEYIDGLTLEGHIRKESLLPVDVVVSLIVQACDALDFAHQQRIVHRDIKPANLMLLPSGRVKITDFGLAKSTSSQLTQEGVLVGTPNYMSPEQITGRPVDGRSDLFSLAAVMYELLTGEKPFTGDTVTTIMYRILHEVPAMPHMVNERIPPPVGRVLQRALEKDPTQRFQSGQEMARALQGRVVAQAVASMTMAGVAGAIPGVPSVFGPATTRASAGRRGAAPPPSAESDWETNKIHALHPDASQTAASGFYQHEQVGSLAAASTARRVARNVAIGIGALAIILMLPRSVPLGDRWGSRPASGGDQPFWSTAAVLAPSASGEAAKGQAASSIPAAETVQAPGRPTKGGGSAPSGPTTEGGPAPTGPTTDGGPAPTGPTTDGGAAANVPPTGAGPAPSGPTTGAVPAPNGPTTEGQTASLPAPAGDRAAKEGTPVSRAGTASGAAPHASPASASADTVAIPMRTSPPGGKIYMDDVELVGGVANLPRGDNAPHTVVAENDCYIEKVTWRRSQGSSLTIPLRTPKIDQVPISSTPPGAAIRLNGKPTGLTTPADVPVPVCGARMVALALDGYQDVQAKVAAEPQAMELSLKRLAMGFVSVDAPYKLDVLLKGKRVGGSGEKIRMPVGKQTLTLRNEDLFVERTLTVNIAADKTINPAPGLPGVGRVTILASPSNCTISLNGRDLGAPPINDYPIAAGTYTVRAIYVPTGEAKEASVTIPAGSTARVPFKFAP